MRFGGLVWVLRFRSWFGVWFGTVSFCVGCFVGGVMLLTLLSVDGVRFGFGGLFSCFVWVLGFLWGLCFCLLEYWWLIGCFFGVFGLFALSFVCYMICPLFAFLLVITLCYSCGLCVG